MHDPLATNRRRMMLMILIGAGLCVATRGAFAGDIAAADAKQVRAVIQAQLAAFAADDAKRAFSLAAPGLRAQFGTAERFVSMVQTSYPVVYRPASVAFLQPERRAREILQGVQLTDDDGRAWLALYHMQRQRDKSWRIAACELAQSEGRYT